jgi:hypothetical protein
MVILIKCAYIMCQVSNANNPSAKMPPSVPPTIAPVLLPEPWGLAWSVCKGSAVIVVELEVNTPSEGRLTGTVVDETEV